GYVQAQYVKTNSEEKSARQIQEVKTMGYALTVAASKINATISFEPGIFSGGPYFKMTLPVALPEMAAIAANSICEHAKIRPIDLKVYLINGELAAQCPKSTW